MNSIRTILFMLLLSVTFVANGQLTYDVTIKFNDLESNEGFVMLLVQDENEKDISKVKLPIFQNSSSTTIKLIEGKYGVSAYHDENNNEKLDLNFVGAPTEDYGFSNNARGTFSKPDYSETLVTVSQNQTITFKLQ